MTQLEAMRLLKSMSILDLGVTSNVEVAKIETIDPENGKPFLWKNSNDNYAIVELKAMSRAGATKALKMFKAGDLDNCCKNNLTARVSLSVVERLRKNMFASVELAEITKRNGELINVVKRVFPYAKKTIIEPTRDLEIVNNEIIKNEKELVIEIFFKNPKVFIDLISEFYPLSQFFLKKFEDKLEWNYISVNEKILWSEELVEKYKRKWNWKAMSQNKRLPWREDFIEKYREDWDWNVISENESLPWSRNLIERYEFLWNWAFLSANESLPWSEDLIEKYKKYWDWHDLSANESLPWSGELLEKYGNLYWDFFSVIANKGLPWSEEFIENFKDNWTSGFYNYDWDLKRNYRNKTPCPKDSNGKICLDYFRFIKPFYGDLPLEKNNKLGWGCLVDKEYVLISEEEKNNLDWVELSNDKSSAELPWSEELIKKFKDKWVWSILCNNKNLPWSIELFYKYACKLEATRSIWNVLKPCVNDELIEEVFNKFQKGVGKDW